MEKTAPKQEKTCTYACMHVCPIKLFKLTRQQGGFKPPAQIMPANHFDFKLADLSDCGIFLLLMNAPNSVSTKRKFLLEKYKLFHTTLWQEISHSRVACMGWNVKTAIIFHEPSMHCEENDESVEVSVELSIKKKFKSLHSLCCLLFGVPC